MKRYLILTLALLGLLSSSTIRAEEPYFKLLEAMRQRGFSDTALEYIESLRERPNVPQEIKSQLSYEEYRVHQEAARLAKTAELKQAALEKALVSLERFAEESPNHPLAGTANSARAGIFLDKAKALIWESRSEKDAREKEEQQTEARKHIAQARDVYETARNQFEKDYAEFKGQFLDERKDAEKFAARREAEQNFIQAQFDLAMCQYQEARTYDQDSQPFLAKLTEAAEMFEEIHSKYRSQGAGLFARIMQGKCFEEQGELGRALGIYDEILGHPGESETMVALKSQTFFFKLIVLNTAEKSDHKLVVSEATKWLEANRRLSKTPTGLGVQWERARALEILGTVADVPEEEQQQYLEQAFSEARELSLYAGEFRDPATAMVQRLEPLVSGESGDPETFGVAFSRARNRVRQFKDLSQKVKGAGNPSAKQAAQSKFDLHLKETERIIRLGLSLIQGDEKPTDVASMRYFLAFTLYYAKKPYDSVAVSDFIVRVATEEQAVQAQDSAYLALAALSQIYYAKPRAQRDAEREMMAGAAQLLVDKWPNSSRADDGRLILGDVYRSAGEPQKASQYFDAVNKTHPRYAEAVLKAGQEYWVAYLTELQKPSETRLDQSQLEQFSKNAESKIKQGLTLVESGLSSEGTPPPIYVLAKVTLVEVLNAQGKEAESLKLFLEGDHNIIKHVSVEDESQRPERGPQSRPVAIQTYQLLLRTYMGLGKIDEAIATMGDLEKVAGSENPDALTQIYIQLGFKLKEEIDRLRAAGNQERLETVIGAFDRFLGALAEREDGLDYSSLLWIAESYANLGDGVEGDTSAAAAYYDKAADAYNKIIERGTNDSSFIDPAYLPSINTRIAVLKKRQGLYEEAFQLISEVLAQNPKQLDAQMEAALILKEWAQISGDNEKYLDAVMGNKRLGESPVYGFGQLGILIQQVMSNPNATIPNIEERYYDVLYEMGDSLFLYGNTQSGDEKNDTLMRAKNTLYQFALNSTPEVDNETWDKFDTLYQEVQTALGEIPEALERPQEVVVQPETTESIAGTDGPAETKAIPEAVPVKLPPRDDPSYGLAILAFVVALAAVGGGFFFIMKQPKKAARRIPGRGEDAPVSIAVPAGGVAQPPTQPAKPKPVQRPASKPAPQPAMAEASTAPQKPVKKKKSIDDLTPEEKAALKKKLLAKKKAEAAKAAQAKKSQES